MWSYIINLISIILSTFSKIPYNFWILCLNWKEFWYHFFYIFQSFLYSIYIFLSLLFFIILNSICIFDSRFTLYFNNFTLNPYLYFKSYNPFGEKFETKKFCENIREILKWKWFYNTKKFYFTKICLIKIILLCEKLHKVFLFS